MTGGDNSAVTIWETASGSIHTRLTGITNQHKAWIWCVRFDSTGSHMFTCSSDRSMKIWQRKGPVTWSVLKTIGGHSHRVCMASIEPGRGSKMVTSALDRYKFCHYVINAIDEICISYLVFISTVYIVISI